MIIGFCGRKRSGKSEAAKYLSEKLGYPIYSFAAAVKSLVTEMSGLTDEDKTNEDFYTGRVIDLKPLKKELFKNRYDQLTVNEIDHIRAIEYYKCHEIYRNLMQYVGTNIFRTRNNLHWCNKFNQLHKKEDSFIVDDVRFKNEFYVIYNSKDSNIYKIERSSAMSDDTHPSEIEFEQFKIKPENIIYNNSGDMKTYHVQLNKFFKLG